MADTTIGRVSEDGLWEWNGKKWIHVRQAALPCEQCGQLVKLSTLENQFRCANGHRQDFISCQTCHGTYQLPRDQKLPVRCPYCSGRQAARTISTAWMWMEYRRARGLGPSDSVGDIDPDRRLLRGYLLHASGGSRIPSGTICDIDFASEGITIKGNDLQEYLSYSEVQALQVTGKAQTTSAGVWGFGAEGMMLAAAMNAASRKTTIYSALRIAGRSSEYVFLRNEMHPDDLSMMLTPVQPRIRHAQALAPAAATPATSSGSIADELGKLAKLRDEGVLNDAEFAAAKARLLAG